MARFRGVAARRRPGLARRRPRLTRRWPLLAVVIGGMAGSLVRWGLLSDSVFGMESEVGGSEALAVFGLNVFGALFLGSLLGQRERLSDNRYNLLGTGFAGGLTTFSNYAVDVATKLEDGSLIAGFGNGLATPIVAVLAGGFGYRMSRAAGLALMRRRSAKGQGAGGVHVR